MSTNTKTVLFVCVGNTCRSQMAAAITNQNLAGRWVAVSGGIRTKWERDERTQRVLQKNGFNAEIPAATNITNYAGKEFDLIITLDDEVSQPVAELFKSTPIKHQPIEDPFQKRVVNGEELDLTRHQRTIDEIIEKVIPMLKDS